MRGVGSREGNLGVIEVQGGNSDSWSSSGLALKPGMIAERMILGLSFLIAVAAHVHSMVLLSAMRGFRAAIVHWLSKVHKRVISSAWACK